MNLSDINWELNAAGTWPLFIKVIIILIICSAVIAGCIYYDTMDQLDELKQVEQKELDLRNALETKQKKVANLQAYRDQLKEIEELLAEMLKQLPTKTEVASLLVDISQTGLASGLEFNLFQPQGGINKEFYKVLPIKIQVVGKFEEFGLFVSGVASLPRIVTVHNVRIAPIKEGDIMQMNATVKTYSESTGQPKKAKNRKRKRR